MNTIDSKIKLIIKKINQKNEFLYIFVNFLLHINFIWKKIINNIRMKKIKVIKLKVIVER